MQTGSVIIRRKTPTIKNGSKSVFDTSAFARLVRDVSPVLIAIEKVHAMPKQGVVSTFTFGENYGVLKGIAAALYIPLVEYRPQEWQSEFFRGMSKDLGKQRSVVYCSALFPQEVNLTDGECDAILIALHARKQFKPP